MKKVTYREFTYHLISPEGIKVDYTTNQKRASDLIDKHPILVGWFEKQGWKFEKESVKGKKPGIIFDPTKTIPCPICKQPMTPKQGISKTGKPWKGYFCSNRDHPPVWAV